MNNSSRAIFQVILIGLLIGHVSVAVHAATHVSEDPGECELCISYSDASKVLAHESQHEVPTGGRSSDTAPVSSEFTLIERLPVRQRGPPALI